MSYFKVNFGQCCKIESIEAIKFWLVMAKQTILGLAWWCGVIVLTTMFATKQSQLSGKLLPLIGIISPLSSIIDGHYTSTDILVTSYPGSIEGCISS